MSIAKSIVGDNEKKVNEFMQNQKKQLCNNTKYYRNEYAKLQKHNAKQ